MNGNPGSVDRCAVEVLLEKDGLGPKALRHLVILQVIKGSGDLQDRNIILEESLGDLMGRPGQGLRLEPVDFSSVVLQ